MAQPALSRAIGPESLAYARQVEIIGAALGRPLAVHELTVAQWQASAGMP
ncbi:hypothetical protein Acsp02_84620 [Actinoplanes sp. NBRC 103695]|nr:hypothetical protein Acsp02_84620 [Actinoplanes sp. NBRC 103695]